MKKVRRNNRRRKHTFSHPLPFPLHKKIFFSLFVLMIYFFAVQTLCTAPWAMIACDVRAIQIVHDTQGEYGILSPNVTKGREGVSKIVTWHFYSIFWVIFFFVCDCFFNLIFLTQWQLVSFHQRYTYKFYVRILFQQLFSSYAYVEKAAKMTFVRKICTYNIDEIDT